MLLYKYADRVTKRLNKVFINRFMHFTASFDELNVIRASDKLYKELYTITKQQLLKIAKNKKPDLDDTFIMAILLSYDPVVKYVFEHETERKRMRFAEAYIASKADPKEIKRALRLWTAGVSQYAITVADKAYIEQLKARGVSYVKWITVPDERLCTECSAMHGKIHPINRIPPKPHIGCRCYVEPAKRGDVSG